MSSRRNPGSFSFFLRAHVPWIPPEERGTTEQAELCRNTVECYLPLARALCELREEGLRGGITWALSPVLAEQLSSPRFPALLREHLRQREREARNDAARFRAAGERRSASLARTWEERAREARKFFDEELSGRLLETLAELERCGTVELATTAATHAFLPLLCRPETVALQVELARRVHERRFARAPAGFWLPEWGYWPPGARGPAGLAGEERQGQGLPSFLGRAGLRYFAVDAALFLGGRLQGRRIPGSRRGAAPAKHLHQPYRIDAPGNAGLAFFTRDPGAHLRVLAGRTRYAADPAFLDLSERSSSPHSYHRITRSPCPPASRERYDPAASSRRIEELARDFADHVARELHESPRPALLVAAFDAETLGTRWHEGVGWLARVLELLHEEPSVELATLGDYLERHPPAQSMRLPEGGRTLGPEHPDWTSEEAREWWLTIHEAERTTWRLCEDARASGRAFAQRCARAAARALLLLCDSEGLVRTPAPPGARAQGARWRLRAAELAQLARGAQASLRAGAEEPRARDFLAKQEECGRLFPEIDEVINALPQPSRQAPRRA